MVRYFEDLAEGESHDLGSYTADREELLAFARRYDPQPIHTDPEMAAETMYGGLIASGWHTAGSCMALLVENFLAETATLGSFGLEELRWRAPVYPGDTVRVAVEVIETRASESREDRGYVTNDVVAENEAGEEVLFWRSTNIFITEAGRDQWPRGE
ncbi:MaoC/PaaZ C-terminal domain-containing protein [Halobellus sp. GM3]|uniref:MaoC/PaaZ C-terminal domain-containing protein n=1 Tax=Halobellus sp. GM3 TaxID=3458410 RepID=UPI00403DD749